MKYGWEICDEVQRFVGNTSDIHFIEKSAYDTLKLENQRLREALESICGNRCAQQNPCEAREALEGK